MKNQTISSVNHDSIQGVKQTIEHPYSIDVYRLDGHVPYEAALSMMQDLHTDIVDGKKNDSLMLLSHAPIITKGTSTKDKDIMMTDNPIDVFQANRGGRATYHGPGQAVIYFCLHFDRFDRDIKRFLCFIQQAVLETLKSLGVEAIARDDHIGFWCKDKENSNNAADKIKTDDPTAYNLKIGSIGLRFSRGVSYHGIAVNIDPDMSHFNYLNPCGIFDNPQDSLQMSSLKELGHDISMDDFFEAFLGVYARVI